MKILQPKDIIAVVALISLVLLKFYQNDASIDPLITLIIGYYFAKRHQGTDGGV